MDEKERADIYAIPANYTESGKILGGLLSLRNVIEAIIILAVFGYIESFLVPGGNVRIVVMAITLIPTGIFSVMGIDGDSLFQYLKRIVSFLKNRRKMHFKRMELTDEDQKKC